MKKIFLIILVTSLSLNSFATHYVQKGNVDEAKSNYFIYKERVFKMPKIEVKPFYDFYGDCSGLKQAESGLEKTGKAEYTGASGTVHNIAKIFSTYERRAMAMGDSDYSFNSHHDTDVFVVFTKEGKDFTINIYTGSDAITAKEAASKK